MHKSALLCFLICNNYFNQVEVSTQPTFGDGTSDYSKVVTTSAFVDKTLFIKEIIQNNKTSVISAPPGFGKSTNLDMLKRFFEIEVDEYGELETKAKHTKEPVKDTSNYKLFTDHMLKITKEETIMNEYFGRVPVMVVSFKCDKVINDFDGAMNVFKEIVHRTYKQYRYLEKSDKLGPIVQEYIRTWCDEENYHMFGKQRVMSSLRELSEYLHKHFGDPRVFVLVDDHESVINQAVVNIQDEDVVDDIVRFSVTILNALLKNNNRHVQGALITGVEDVPVFGSNVHNTIDPDSYHIYRFLEDHRFVDFYGLTKEELDGLLTYPKLKLGEEVVEKAKAKYGGYKSKNGKEIYNLYSILHFLQSGETDNFFTKFNPITTLNDVLQIEAMKECVEKLLENEPIAIEVPAQVTVQYLVALRNLLSGLGSEQVQATSDFFFYLLQEGYLTYDPEVEVEQEEGENKVAVSIPNGEIKEVFTESMET